MAVLGCSLALAQKPDYNVGRAATPDEIKAWDISVSPDGHELPPGSGTAKQGVPIFAAKCAACHGPTGEETKLLFARLVGGQGTLKDRHVVETTGSFWPYATSIFDFIRRAMPEVPYGPDSLPPDYIFTTKPIPPLESGMSGKGAGPMLKGADLKPDEIYALVAVILYRNGIIKEDDLMNRETLPKVVMPNRNGFLPPADSEWVWKSRDPKTRIEPHVAPNSKSLPAGTKPANVVY